MQTPTPWRRVFLTMLGVAAGLCALSYAFVALIDPWNVLPLSPPAPRVPISTNARFSFPALARSQDFDAAILGTSTSRLLRPATLNPLLGARFVNLAMNSATAWEQTRLLGVFLRAHPHPRAVLIGLDAPWCATDAVYEQRTTRDFPDWMYGRDRWAGYAHIFSLYAMQEAANQFAVMLQLQKRRYGLDGYTNFTPPEAQYDAARAHAHMLTEGTPDALGGNPAFPASTQHFPAHELLARILHDIPADTPKLLFFVPYLHSYQGQPGTLAGAMWAECKLRVTRMAQDVPGTVVADFMIPSPVTLDETHYWDPKHYRTPVADRLAGDLALAAHGQPTPDDRLLHSQP